MSFLEVMVKGSLPKGYVSRDIQSPTISLLRETAAMFVLLGNNDSE